MLPSSGGTGEGQFGPSGSGVTAPVVGPCGQDQDRGFLERATPGVVFAMRVALLAAVFSTGAAELAEGDRVAAGFGKEVAAVAEHVRPLAEPGPGGG